MTFNQALIFDMDGVLIDSEPIHIAVEKQIYEHLSIPFDELKHARFLGTSNRYMWQVLKEENGFEQSVEDVIQYNKQLFFQALSRNTSVSAVAHVENVLKEFKSSGFGLAVASSSGEEVIEKVLQTIGLRHYFEHLVSGESVPKSKPAPDIFIKTAELLGVSNDQCVVIEDSSNGIVAAKKAGMKCIAFTGTGQSYFEQAADMEISSFEKLNVTLASELLAIK